MINPTDPKQLLLQSQFCKYFKLLVVSKTAIASNFIPSLSFISLKNYRDSLIQIVKYKPPQWTFGYWSVTSESPLKIFF